MNFNHIEQPLLLPSKVAKSRTKNKTLFPKLIDQEPITQNLNRAATPYSPLSKGGVRM